MRDARSLSRQRHPLHADAELRRQTPNAASPSRAFIMALVTSQQQALPAVYEIAMRQASVLSFLDISRHGVVCLMMLPLVPILRRPRHTSRAAHVVAA